MGGSSEAWLGHRPPPPKQLELTFERDPRGGGRAGEIPRPHVHACTRLQGLGLALRPESFWPRWQGLDPILLGSWARVLAPAGQAPVAAPRIATTDLEGRPFWRGGAGRPGAGPPSGPQVGESSWAGGCP